eukprot:s842_g13.t1
MLVKAEPGHGPFKKHGVAYSCRTCKSFEDMYAPGSWPLLVMLPQHEGASASNFCIVALHIPLEAYDGSFALTSAP